MGNRAHRVPCARRTGRNDCRVDGTRLRTNLRSGDRRTVLRMMQVTRGRQEGFLDGGEYQVVPGHRRGDRRDDGNREIETVGKKGDRADVALGGGIRRSRIMVMVVPAGRGLGVRQRVQRRVHRHRPKRQHQRGTPGREQAAEGGDPGESVGVAVQRRRNGSDYGRCVKGGWETFNV